VKREVEVLVYLASTELILNVTVLSAYGARVHLFEGVNVSILVYLSPFSRSKGFFYMFTLAWCYLSLVLDEICTHKDSHLKLKMGLSFNSVLW
jgi:hypothetical protein